MEDPVVTAAQIAFAARIKDSSDVSDKACHAPSIRQKIISGISANRSSLIGAVTMLRASLIAR
jgi:hypothetical protein